MSSGTFIATTTEDDVQWLMAAGQSLGLSVAQLRHHLTTVLGPAHGALLAEPLEDAGSRSTDWYGEGEGEATPLPALPPDRRAAAGGHVWGLLRDIRDEAVRLMASGDSDERVLGAMLERVAQVPGLDCVRLRGETAVLIAWAHGRAGEAVDLLQALRPAEPVRPVVAPGPAARAALPAFRQWRAVGAARRGAWLPFVAAAAVAFAAVAVLMPTPIRSWLAPGRDDDAAGLQAAIDQTRERLRRDAAACPPSGPDTRRTGAVPTPLGAVGGATAVPPVAAPGPGGGGPARGDQGPMSPAVPSQAADSPAPSLQAPPDPTRREQAQRDAAAGGPASPSGASPSGAAPGGVAPVSGAPERSRLETATRPSETRPAQTAAGPKPAAETRPGQTEPAGVPSKPGQMAAGSGSERETRPGRTEPAGVPGGPGQPGSGSEPETRLSQAEPAAVPGGPGSTASGSGPETRMTQTAPAVAPGGAGPTAAAPGRDARSGQAEPAGVPGGQPDRKPAGQAPNGQAETSPPVVPTPAGPTLAGQAPTVPAPADRAPDQPSPAPSRTEGAPARPAAVPRGAGAEVGQVPPVPPAGEPGLTDQGRQDRSRPEAAGPSRVAGAEAGQVPPGPPAGEFGRTDQGQQDRSRPEAATGPSRVAEAEAGQVPPGPQTGEPGRTDRGPPDRAPSSGGPAGATVAGTGERVAAAQLPLHESESVPGARPFTEAAMRGHDLSALQGCWAMEGEFASAEMQTRAAVKVTRWRTCFASPAPGAAMVTGTQQLGWEDGKTCSGPVTGRFVEGDGFEIADASDCLGDRTLFRMAEQCTRRDDATLSCSWTAREGEYRGEGLSLTPAH